MAAHWPAARAGPRIILVLEGFERRNGFEPPQLGAEIGHALGASGDRQRALATMRRMEAKREHAFVDPYLVAVIYGAMDDREATFAWLKKALEVRSSFAISLLTEPTWEPFRGIRGSQSCCRRCCRAEGLIGRKLSSTRRGSGADAGVPS